MELQAEISGSEDKEMSGRIAGPAPKAKPEHQDEEERLVRKKSQGADPWSA